MSVLPRKTTFETMVAGLLADMHWMSILYDRDEYGNVIYKGCNVHLDAQQDDTDWYIWRYTKDVEKGPIVGSWINRENLEWSIVGVTLTATGKTDYLDQVEYLDRILAELKKITLQLSLITDEKVTEEDIKGYAD